MNIDTEAVALDIVLDDGESAAVKEPVVPSTDLIDSPIDRARTVARAPMPQHWSVSVTLSRLLARSVDLLWQFSVLGLVLELVFPIAEMSPITLLVVLLVIIPSALLLDALVQGVFGNTPGKQLLGIQPVTWRGKRLTIIDSFQRNFLLWRFGFLFGLLPLLPFSLYGQWRRVCNGSRTGYDDQLHLRVRRFNRSVVVDVMAAMAASLILILLATQLVFGKPVIESAASWPRGLWGTASDAVPAAVNLKLDLDAESLATLAQPDSVTLVEIESANEVVQLQVEGPDPNAGRWWTNPYTAFVTQIDMHWVDIPVSVENATRVYHSVENLDLSLEKIDKQAVDYMQQAQRVLSKYHQSESTFSESEFFLQNQKGRRIVVNNTGTGALYGVVEWMMIEDTLYRMVLKPVAGRPAMPQKSSVIFGGKSDINFAAGESLMIILWGTFI